MYRKSDFARRADPIHDFWLGKDGTLRHAAYDRYQVVLPRIDRTTYRIWIPPGTRMLSRTELQLDRIVDGHYVSFRYDPAKALSAMRAHWEAKIAAARKEIGKASGQLRILDAIAAQEGGEGP